MLSLVESAQIYPLRVPRQRIVDAIRPLNPCLCVFRDQRDDHGFYEARLSVQRLVRCFGATTADRLICH